MYTIHGKGIVWDAENNRPLAMFAGGLFMTSDETVALKLQEMGYRVDYPEKPKGRKKAGD